MTETEMRARLAELAEDLRAGRLAGADTTDITDEARELWASIRALDALA